ncbi:MAG: hypothetical protein ACOC10_03935 [Bacteroidota bacterium]
MELDIRTTAIKIRLRALFITIGVSTLVIIVLLTDLFREPVLGMERGVIVLIIILAYLAISVYFYMLNMNYIYYNDDGAKIILRFYSMRPLEQKKRAFEIPKEKFVRYELKKDMGGLREFLILYQQTPKGVFRYPPVSLTALSFSEKSRLLKRLSGLVTRHI